MSHSIKITVNVQTKQCESDLRNRSRCEQVITFHSMALIVWLRIVYVFNFLAVPKAYNIPLLSLNIHDRFMSAHKKKVFSPFSSSITDRRHSSGLCRHRQCCSLLIKQFIYCYENYQLFPTNIPFKRITSSAETFEYSIRCSAVRILKCPIFSNELCVWINKLWVSKRLFLIAHLPAQQQLFVVGTCWEWIWRRRALATTEYRILCKKNR